MVFFCLIFSGISSAVKMRERVRILVSLSIAVQNMKRELAFSMPALAELFGCGNCDITDIIKTNIQNGKTPRDSLSQAFGTYNVKRLLTVGERDFLTNILSDMGNGDCDNAVQILDEVQDRLKIYIDSAEENERKNAKIHLIISFYAGVAVVIMFL